MAITESPSNKFAFLLTGSADARYVEDLKMVFQTLTEYYGYPKNQIWVVFGQLLADTSFFDGATKTTLTNLSDLEVAFDNFNAVAGTSTDDTLLLYFTGEGISDELVLGGITDNLITSLLEEKIADIADGQVNVVMQQSYAGTFHDAASSAGTSVWSFTNACSNTEASQGDSTGSNFTKAWTMGLQFQTLAGGQFADQLAPTGYELQITLEQAMDFAVAKLAVGSTPEYDDVGGPMYLGKPAFLIRDGDQAIPLDSWWESPDIYITNSQYPTSTDNDIYVADETNMIHVNIKNSGTHPVRSFWMGHMVFFSGGGGAGIPEVINLTSATIVKTGDTYPYTYDYNFPDTYTHRCIKAKARLTEILPEDIDTDNTDDVDWHVTDEDCEAQRNLDKFNPPPPPPEQPAPEPDNADMDEEIPEEEAEPDPADEDNGSRSMRNIRGFKEHIYCIRNIFKKPHKFLIVFPKDYRKYKKFFRIEWFRMNDDLVNSLTQLEIVEKPYMHIPVKLEPGETMNILFYLALLPGVDFNDEIRLPFDILVDVNKDILDQIKAKIRKTVFYELKSEYAPFSGITVVVSQGKGSTIIGRVTDRNNKPVPGSLVFIRTINERQSAVTMTDKEGLYIMPRINSDSYKLMAETDKWHTKKKTVFISDGDKSELVFSEKESIPGKSIKVILDRIRILDDHDPCLKGKGELTFTTVVVPDKDDKKKQVRRLPEKGIYHVSDKPGKNDIDLGVTIFEGSASESLSIGISGKEIDFFDRNDELSRYYRSFRGDPKKWYGKYQPGDEYLDKENVGDWQVWYRIVRM